MSTAADVAAAHVCSNCGAATGGRYCSECGQRRLPERLTLRSLAAGFLGRVFNLEAGLAHTAYQLAVRPEAVIQGYISGITARYTHPAAYLLITFAAFSLSAVLFGGLRGGGGADRIAVLLLVPCVAVASRVLFARARFNYAEHLILVMFTLAQVTLGFAAAQAAFTLLDPVHARSLAGATFGVGIAYVVWVYARMFRDRALLAALGGLLALVGGTVLWFVAVANALQLLRR
jgi:hypothetical protein